MKALSGKMIWDNQFSVVSLSPVRKVNLSLRLKDKDLYWIYNQYIPL